MAVTAWATASSINRVGTAPGFWGQFGNPTWDVASIGTDDTSYAYHLLTAIGQETDLAYAYNFGFSVPSGATIDGVEVELLVGSANSDRFVRAKEALLTTDGGTSRTGTNTATQTPVDGAPSSVLHGGSTSLWGVTLTDTIVNSSNFGVSFVFDRTLNGGSSSDTAVEVDFLRMRVYYTTGGGTTVTGSGAATTAAVTASGTAEREITGTGAATTAATTASGTGSVQGTVTGTGAATTAAITASGVAEREITGTGAATIGAVTASGTATTGNAIAGSGAATIAAITASGTAEREITASGAVTTGATQASGTASRGQDATGAATIAAVTASGTAEREITGTGAATIGAVEASGIGALDGEVTGSGAATIAPVDASGSGIVVSITPERQPGGWLPTIYVDRDGNEVDLDEKVAEVVAEAKADATKPQRKKIAKAAPEVIAAFRADEFKPTKEMERLAAHLGQVEAKYERMLRDAIEARRRQDEDDEAVALLLIA